LCPAATEAATAAAATKLCVNQSEWLPQQQSDYRNTANSKEWPFADGTNPTGLRALARLV